MVPSYHLSIETPTPLVLGVGVMFAPVTCFVHLCCLVGDAVETICWKRTYEDRKKSSRPSGSVPTVPPTSPRAETSSGVSRPGTSSSSSSLPLGGQGRQGGSQDAPGVLSGVGVPLGCRLGCAGSLPLLLLLRERAKWELPARCRLPFPAPPTSLSLPNSHRTFHDVRIRGSLRGLATACYPSVVPDLRIEEQGRIRGPGHEGVALVNVAVVLALAPLPVCGQEVESVDAGHRPLSSLLVTARGVEALGLDPRIDTSHAVTALGVTGCGLLTATGCAVIVRVSLPAGEIGVTASGHTLSRIARMTARGQAGDYLALLPACGRRRQDGWPDEKPRRVLGRWPRSLLWFLKRRRLSLLLQEGQF